MDTLDFYMEVYKIFYRLKGLIYCVLICIHYEFIGISALVIDNSYGMLFMSLQLPPAFTANLDINYRFIKYLSIIFIFLFVLIVFIYGFNCLGNLFMKGLFAYFVLK